MLNDKEGHFPKVNCSEYIVCPNYIKCFDSLSLFLYIEPYKLR